MARQETANTLINRTAVEVGVRAVSDPVSSSEEVFVQLTGLLTSVGQELCELRAWQVLRQVIDFTVDTASSATQLGDGVTVGDSGTYLLPADFCYMIDQTGWDKTNETPAGGPLSAQIWTYLGASAIGSPTLEIGFRQANNKLDVYPQPVPDGTNVSFEYISRNWVQQSGQTSANTDVISNGSDIVVFEPILVVKYLKVKFLEAKGFDASAARLELDTMFNARTGRDTGAPILNAGGRSGYPYINGYRNVGDTGYGV